MRWHAMRQPDACQPMRGNDHAKPEVTAGPDGHSTPVTRTPDPGLAEEAARIAAEILRTEGSSDPFRRLRARHAHADDHHRSTPGR